MPNANTLPFASLLPDTHVLAAAGTLFGSDLTPGVHSLAADVDGWTWYAVVSDERRLIAMAVLADGFNSEATADAIERWRDSVLPPKSTVPALRLLGTDDRLGFPEG